MAYWASGYLEGSAVEAVLLAPAELAALSLPYLSWEVKRRFLKVGYS